MDGLIRQGDILLVPVEEKQSRTDIRKLGRTVPRKRGQGIIVAEGEATGHHHRVRTKGVRFIERGGRMFLDVPGEAELEHEEHDTLTIPKGLHEVRRQREYAPQQAPRRVFD